MDPKANRLALKVALIYVIVAGSWILFSDEFVGMLVTSPVERVHLSIYKGWAFVLVTGYMLFRVITFLLKRWAEETEVRLQAEATQHELEEKYRRIFDVTTDAVFLVDSRSGSILDANPAAEQMYGHNREELLRLNAVDISAEPEKTKNAIASGAVHIPLRLHRRKNGDVFSEEISCSEFQFKGQAVHVAVMRDITERKRVEAALQLSDFSVKYASLPTFWIASDSRIVRVNDAACRQLGYAEAEMLKLAITDLDPDFAPERWPMHWQELRNQKRMSFETSHRHKDGHVIPVEVHLNWFEFEGREYNFAFAHDITERKRADAALQNSTVQMRKLLEKVPVPLCQSAADGTILLHNERFIHTFGYGAVDVPDVEAWMRRAYPDAAYREQVTSQWTLAVQQAAQSGEDIQPQEYLVTCKSGEKRAVEISGTSFGDGLLVTFMDLTARKRAEAALRESEYFFKESQRAARIGSYICDFKTGFWESSEILDQILGISRSFRRNIEGWLALIHPDDREMMQRYLQEEVLTKHQPFSKEYRICRQSDGAVRWVSGLGEVSFDANGKALTLIGTIQDVTERKRMEIALMEQLEVQERAATITTTVPGVIYSFLLRPDGSTCFPFASHAVEQHFGFTAAQLARDGSGIFANIHPDDVGNVQAAIMESARALTTWWGEFRYRHPVKGEMWVSGRSEPKRHADGSTVWHGFTMEVTERKRTEKALHESEERLRFVTENAHVGLVVLNRHHCYSFANTAYSEILNLPPGDLVGRPVADVLSTVYEDQIRPRLDLAFAGERVAYEMQRPLAGAQHFYSVTYEPVKVEADETLVVVVITDITARKLMEMALREREEQLLLFVEHSPAAIAMLNLEMKYLVTSRRWLEDYSLGNQPVIGRSHYELFPGISQHWKDIHQRCLAGAVEKSEEEKFVRSDGSIIWLRWETRPWRHADGTIGGIIIFTEDVTERKQASQQLHLQSSALTAAANAIFIADVNGIIQWVNPAFSKLTGFSSEEVVGQNPRLLKSGRQPQEFYRDLWSTILAGKVWHGELVNRRKNGDLYNEDMTITPVFGPRGGVTHFIAIKQDVTERNQLNVRLQQAEKMEAIGTLAGGIAHDFNNILAAMFGYGYLLRQDVAGNTAAEESIGEILNAAGRAKDLVQQILTFSRQREQKRQIVRLNSVAKEAVKFLRASLPAGIKIDLDVDMDAPAVLADPTQVYQVILNLATNSFHAMEGRNGELTVNLVATEPDAALIKLHPGLKPLKYARLMVADTGQGMDAKTLERIFEPFFTTKPVGKGTGLGLAVVHGIIQSHEGVITVESTVGRGTTFFVYFPAQVETTMTATSAMTEAPRGNGQKILVVDDEKALTHVFQKLLTRLGYQVAITNHPHEGWQMFSADPAAFDLVITDLTMPEMNGMELARKINELRPDMPIVLASGFNATLELGKLREIGIQSLLEKPVSITALSEAVTQALGNQLVAV